MKKVLFISVLLFVLAGCNKSHDTIVMEKQSVFFVGNRPDADDLKSVEQECDQPIANYAVIVIDGIVYNPSVFYIGGIPFTEALRFLPGNFSVDDFLLMNDAGTPDDTSDDIIVKAVPKAGSAYADFVSNPVSFSINVAQYEKTEVSLEVICYDESQRELFGFE